MSRRPLKQYRLPTWLWIPIGAAVLAIALPLAWKVFLAGEFDHACPTGRRGVPLDQRHWQLFGGTVAYVFAAGWLAIASAGAMAMTAAARRWAGLAAVLGVVLIVGSMVSVCHA